MKKRSLANFIMTSIILLIIAAGIFTVGCIRGWFDKAEGSTVLQNMRGVVNLQRSGVNTSVQADTVLRSGDILTCENGASATIVIGADRLVLGDNARLTIREPAPGRFRAEISRGSVFIHCQAAQVLEFAGNRITVQNATALISVQDGTQSVSVFRGSVGNANAGQVLYYLPDSQAVETLTLESLNDFALTQLRSYQGAQLCYTAADLDQLETDRQQAIQELIDSQTQLPTTAESTTVTQSTTGTAQPTEPTTPPTSPPEPVTYHCTVAIYCHTVLDHMDRLEPGKTEFVPESGVILYPVSVPFTDGETSFDVLKRVCQITGIQLEYSWTPLYNSYYVEGIHQLYEFDCGFESGWMYQVNGWFPNYGSSDYPVKDGDVVVWAYTCDGLGADLGASVR